MLFVGLPVKSETKIVILFILLFLSVIPIVFFFVNDYSYNEHFIRALLTGHAWIEIHGNELLIFGIGFYGLTSFNLCYVVLLFVSVIVFFTSLALLIRIGYSRRFQRKNGKKAVSPNY